MNDKGTIKIGDETIFPAQKDKDNLCRADETVEEKTAAKPNERQEKSVICTMYSDSESESEHEYEYEYFDQLNPLRDCHLRLVHLSKRYINNLVITGIIPLIKRKWSVN